MPHNWRPFGHGVVPSPIKGDPFVLVLFLGLDRGGQDIDFELYAIKKESEPAIGRTYVWDIPVKILDFFALSLVLFRPLDCRPLQ